MNWWFLRGKVDKRTQQVDRLEQNHDMWTHLFNALLGENDRGTVVYWGGDRRVDYTDRFRELWVPNLKYWKSEDKPQYIFARGGFPQYDHVLRREGSAIKIYYGAGARYCPQGYADYDLVLLDSDRQMNDVVSVYPYLRKQLWTKPAAPHFKPYQAKKKYDVCFIANGQQAKIKRIKWVYDTKPKHLTMLHLGFPSKYDLPENTVQKRVGRMDMPKCISKCRVGIVPYTSYDSAPRAYSEMVACGLPVVCREDTHIGGFAEAVDADLFWEKVEKYTVGSWKFAEAATLESAAQGIWLYLQSLEHE